MVNYINDISTFSFFFYFGVSTLFLFNQISKLYDFFFYFCVSTLSA